MWKRVAKLCEWKRPRAPEVRLLFEDVRAASAVLSFLRDTRLGRIVPLALRERWAGEEDREVDRRERRTGQARPKNVSFLCFSFVFRLSYFIFFGGGFFLC